MKRTATLKVEEYYGYGICRMTGGQEYIFNYGTPADRGFGTLCLNSVDTKHEYTITDPVHQDENTDDPISITVEIEGHLMEI